MAAEGRQRRLVIAGTGKWRQSPRLRTPLLAIDQLEKETNLEIDAQNAQCEETVIDMLHSISWVGQVCVISVLAETQPACGRQTVPLSLGPRSQRGV